MATRVDIFKWKILMGDEMWKEYKRVHDARKPFGLAYRDQLKAYEDNYQRMLQTINGRGYMLNRYFDLVDQSKTEYITKGKYKKYRNGKLLRELPFGFPYVDTRKVDLSDLVTYGPRWSEFIQSEQFPEFIYDVDILKAFNLCTLHKPTFAEYVKSTGGSDNIFDLSLIHI